MKKILVTGATGYLGSHLVKELLRKGFKVVIIARRSSDFSRIRNQESHIEIFYVDELNAMLDKHKDISILIHAATCYGRSGESDSFVTQANLNFPLNVVETLLRKTDSLSRVINIDTILDKFFNPYSLSKKQFTEWLEYYSKVKNITVDNILLNYMYGEEDAKNKFTSFVIDSCLKNVRNINLTSGIQKKDFIYIDDVVSAIYYILNRKLDHVGFYNYPLGSGRVHSVKEYAQLVKKISKSKSNLDFGTVKSRDNEQDDLPADISNLYSLGWKPKYTLIEGLERTIQKEMNK